MFLAGGAGWVRPAPAGLRLDHSAHHQRAYFCVGTPARCDQRGVGAPSYDGGPRRLRPACTTTTDTEARLSMSWDFETDPEFQEELSVKAVMPKVFHDISSRALQIHGSPGVSNEMPFSAMVIESFHMGLADGPTEVHKATLARLLLSQYHPAEGMFATGRLPTRRAESLAGYAEHLEAEVAQL